MLVVVLLHLGVGDDVRRDDVAHVAVEERRLLGRLHLRLHFRPLVEAGLEHLLHEQALAEVVLEEARLPARGGVLLAHRRREAGEHRVELRGRDGLAVENGDDRIRLRGVRARRRLRLLRHERQRTGNQRQKKHSFHEVPPEGIRRRGGQQGYGRGAFREGTEDR